MKTEYHIIIYVLDKWIKDVKESGYNKESQVFIYDEDLEIIDKLFIKDLIKDKYTN